MDTKYFIVHTRNNKIIYRKRIIIVFNENTNIWNIKFNMKKINMLRNDIIELRIEIIGNDYDEDLKNFIVENVRKLILSKLKYEK